VLSKTHHAGSENMNSERIDFLRLIAFTLGAGAIRVLAILAVIRWSRSPGLSDVRFFRARIHCLRDGQSERLVSRGSTSLSPCVVRLVLGSFDAHANEAAIRGLIVASTGPGSEGSFSA